MGSSLADVACPLGLDCGRLSGGREVGLPGRGGRVFRGRGIGLRRRLSRKRVSRAAEQVAGLLERPQEIRTVANPTGALAILTAVVDGNHADCRLPPASSVQPRALPPLLQTALRCRG